MAAAAFDTFLETLREPAQPTLSPTRLADALHLSVGELAEMTREHRNTITGNPGSPQLQSGLREIVKVLAAAASRVNEDRERTLFGYINHPIAEFEYQTPAELVRNGKVEAVLHYLATLEAGSTG
jgi:hypothetical protein